MTWVILTGRNSDLQQVDTPHKIITNRDYLAHPALFRGQRPKVINLSNSYAYQSRGYYASLLAGSRGHKVIPTVETMIDLSERKLYENALPELEVALNKCRKELGGSFPAKAVVLLRHRPVKGLGPFRQASVRLVPRAGAGSGDQGQPGMGVDPEDRPAFAGAHDAGGQAALSRQPGSLYRARMARLRRRARRRAILSPRWSIRARNCRLPKSARCATGRASPRRWASRSSRSPRRDLAKLANYDALFIRETTAISNHTYRFARRAAAGRHAGHRRPAVDDPLHQQGLSQRVDGLQQDSGAADRHDRRPVRPAAGRRHAGFSAGAEDPGQLVFARRQEGVEFRGVEDALRPVDGGVRPADRPEIHPDRV